MILSASGWLLASAGLACALATWWLGARRAEAIARATHELRGPLTAARLGLHAAMRSDRAPAGRLKAIELQLASATLALDDLTTARRGRGRVRPPARASDAVELRDLVAECAEAWRSRAEAEGLPLRLRWSAGPSIVVGDRLRLAQATGNLIANAIEHGGGLIEVVGRNTEAAVQVEVIDGGAGLPAPVSVLARRAGRQFAVRGRERRRAGRGRGLAIATEIAHAHGGRLAAGPSKRGARLVFELPLGRPDSACAGD